MTKKQTKITDKPHSSSSSSSSVKQPIDIIAKLAKHIQKPGTPPPPPPPPATSAVSHEASNGDSASEQKKKKVDDKPVDYMAAFCCLTIDFQVKFMNLVNTHGSDELTATGPLMTEFFAEMKLREHPASPFRSIQQARKRLTEFEEGDRVRLKSLYDSCVEATKRLTCPSDITPVVNYPRRDKISIFKIEPEYIAPCFTKMTVGFHRFGEEACSIKVRPFDYDVYKNAPNAKTAEMFEIATLFEKYCDNLDILSKPMPYGVMLSEMGTQLPKGFVWKYFLAIATVPCEVHFDNSECLSVKTKIASNTLEFITLPAECQWDCSVFCEKRGLPANGRIAVFALEPKSVRKVVTVPQVVEVKPVAVKQPLHTFELHEQILQMVKFLKSDNETKRNFNNDTPKRALDVVSALCTANPASKSVVGVLNEAFKQCGEKSRILLANCLYRSTVDCLSGTDVSIVDKVKELSSVVDELSQYLAVNPDFVTKILPIPTPNVNPKSYLYLCRSFRGKDGKMKAVSSNAMDLIVERAALRLAALSVISKTPCMVSPQKIEISKLSLLPFEPSYSQYEKIVTPLLSHLQLHSSYLPFVVFIWRCMVVEGSSYIFGRNEKEGLNHTLNEFIDCVYAAQPFVLNDEKLEVDNSRKLFGGFPDAVALFKICQNLIDGFARVMLPEKQRINFPILECDEEIDVTEQVEVHKRKEHPVTEEEAVQETSFQPFSFDSLPDVPVSCLFEPSEESKSEPEPIPKKQRVDNHAPVSSSASSSSANSTSSLSTYFPSRREPESPPLQSSVKEDDVQAESSLFNEMAGSFRSVGPSSTSSSSVLPAYSSSIVPPITPKVSSKIDSRFLIGVLKKKKRMPVVIYGNKRKSLEDLALRHIFRYMGILGGIEIPIVDDSCLSGGFYYCKSSSEPTPGIFSFNRLDPKMCYVVKPNPDKGMKDGVLCVLDEGSYEKHAIVSVISKNLDLEYLTVANSSDYFPQIWCFNREK